MSGFRRFPPCDRYILGNRHAITGVVVGGDVFLASSKRVIPAVASLQSHVVAAQGSANLDGLHSEQLTELPDFVRDVADADGTMMGRALHVPLVDEAAGTDREAVTGVRVTYF